MTILDFFKKNKFSRNFGWVIFTIFLGAIGSGLWERFLSHAVERLSNAILFSISYIFHGYLDILHQGIGKADLYRMAMFPYMFMIVAMVMFYWISVIWLYLAIRRNRNVVSTETNMDNMIFGQKAGLKILIFIALLMTIIWSSDLLQESYNHKACIFIEQSIDILAPFLDRESLLKLRSNYRSIDNANKFYDLESKLRAIATENKIELPRFTVIR